jgi:tetratricopeptide (TPR) repeat protein
MKSWISALLAAATMAGSAHADERARFTGTVTLTCAFDSLVIKADFATMTAVATRATFAPKDYRLHWATLAIASGETAQVLVLTRDFAGAYESYALDTAAGIFSPGPDDRAHAGDTLPSTYPGLNRDPGLLPLRCRDDRSLIPAPEFAAFEARQATAENEPPIAKAKGIAAALAPAERKRAQARIKEAASLANAGECDGAVPELKAALAIDPSSAAGNFYLAECYAQRAQTKLARVRWQRTIDLAPKSKEAAEARSRLAARGAR